MHCYRKIADDTGDFAPEGEDLCHSPDFLLENIRSALTGSCRFRKALWNNKETKQIFAFTVPQESFGSLWNDKWTKP